MIGCEAGAWASPARQRIVQTSHGSDSKEPRAERVKPSFSKDTSDAHGSEPEKRESAEPPLARSGFSRLSLSIAGGASKDPYSLKSSPSCSTSTVGFVPERKGDSADRGGEGPGG